MENYSGNPVGAPTEKVPRVSNGTPPPPLQTLAVKYGSEDKHMDQHPK